MLPRVAVLSLVALAASLGATAEEPLLTFGAVVDLRYVHTDSERSWLDGGAGRFRYGAGVNGRADLLRLSQLALTVDADLGPEVAAFVQLGVDAEPDERGFRARADLVEAYLSYRPDLSARVQLRLRGGAFFPPISLEHVGPAWTSPYSITGAVANSWIGEELKTVGLEGTLVFRWDRDQLRLTGAGFGSNDPAGTLLAWRGWSMNDRQTGFGDRLFYPPVPGGAPGGPFARNADWVQPMVEVDGRVGWYAGASLRRESVFEARALRYDNRGDQTVFDGWQYAWLTRFSAYGLRIELPGEATLLAQHMRGDTHMGRTPAGEEAVRVPFETSYGLISVPIGRHRVTVRYDRFETHDTDALPEIDANDESGEAWTAAYVFEATEQIRIAVEAIRLEADRDIRPLQDLPRSIDETLFQVSWRLAF